MTGTASGCGVIMIKGCRRPGMRVMTILAEVVGRVMSRRLARGSTAIVTTEAVT